MIFFNDKEAQGSLEFCGILEVTVYVFFSLDLQVKKTS